MSLILFIFFLLSNSVIWRWSHKEYYLDYVIVHLNKLLYSYSSLRTYTYPIYNLKDLVLSLSYSYSSLRIYTYPIYNLKDLKISLLSYMSKTYVFFKIFIKSVSILFKGSFKMASYWSACFIKRIWSSLVYFIEIIYYALIYRLYYLNYHIYTYSVLISVYYPHIIFKLSILRCFFSFFIEFKRYINSISIVVAFFYMDQNVSFYYMFILLNSLSVIYTIYIKYIDPDFIQKYPKMYSALQYACNILSIISLIITIYTIFINSGPSSPNPGPSGRAPNQGGNGGGNGPSWHVEDDNVRRTRFREIDNARRTRIRAYNNAMMTTIREKVEYRWEHYPRHKSVFCTFDLRADGYNSNITPSERTFLANKVLEHGLMRSRPFAVLKWLDGENVHFYRVVRMAERAVGPTFMLENNRHSVLPRPGQVNHVRPSVEFRDYLEDLQVWLNNR